MSNINGELKALLHVQQGTYELEACWMEGHHAAGEGIEEAKNPFGPNTQAWEYWNDGWWAGFYGEEALYPEYSFASESPESSVKEEATNDIHFQPGSDIVKNFLYTLGASVGACLLATSIIDMAA